MIAIAVLVTFAITAPVSMMLGAILERDRKDPSARSTMTRRQRRRLERERLDLNVAHRGRWS